MNVKELITALLAARYIDNEVVIQYGDERLVLDEVDTDDANAVVIRVWNE